MFYLVLFKVQRNPVFKSCLLINPAFLDWLANDNQYCFRITPVLSSLQCYCRKKNPETQNCFLFFPILVLQKYWDQPPSFGAYECENVIDKLFLFEVINMKTVIFNLWRNFWFFFFKFRNEFKVLLRVVTVAKSLIGSKARNQVNTQFSPRKIKMG